MKTLIKVYGALLLLLLYYKGGAQCNATFSYVATSATSYSFNSNQLLQNGYTYYHTWKVNGVAWSTTTNTTYTFPQGGNYDVCHIINIQDAGANTICTDSACVYLQITLQPPCLPQIYVSAAKISSHEYQFSSNLTNYTNLSLIWTFGDGASDTGTAAPTHYYQQYGTYNACLRVTDTVQNCSVAVCRTVHPDTTTTPPCQLYARYSAQQQNLSVPSVTFSNNSVGTYHVQYWDYGDGTTSNTMQPIHLYPAVGNYLVCLTITDTISACTDNYCGYISVDSCRNTFAQFGISYTQPTGTITTYTTGLSGITPLNWHWDFGDGSRDSTSLHPTHAYPTTDTFNVCFTVTVNGCAPVANCRSAIIECDIQASFTKLLIGPNTVQFHSTSQGSYKRYRWIFGDGTFGDEQDPVHVYNTSGTYNACLVAEDTIFGCSDTTCATLLVTALCDTICGYVFADYNYNGIQDPTETPMAGISIRCNPSGMIFTTDTNGYYEGLVPWDIFSGNTSIDLLYAPQHINTMPVFSSSYAYSFALPGIRQCGFDFGIATFCARIAGMVYADYNQDSIYSSGEGLIPNQLVRKGNTAALTGSDGTYILDVPIGNHIIRLDTNGVYRGFSVNPSSYSLNTPQPGGLHSNTNFGVAISNNYSDITLDLIPLTPVALSHKVNYKLLTTNLGSGTPFIALSMTHDAALSFNAANPTMSYNASTRTASGTGFIGPFAQLARDISFDISPGTVINQNIYNTAQTNVLLGTDANLANNNAQLHQIVVASFDPNNKLPDVCGSGSEGYITPTQKIKFVINFENTGTYYAMNIVVKDILDKNFDLSTFRYIGSSHPSVCDVKLNGDSLYFRFSGIKLPFNKPQSQGWVAFEITPKQNLLIGDQLHNTAAIYFDHNDPIITNTTLHTIGEPDAIKEVKTGLLKATPNPFADEVTISTQHIAGANCTYTLTDLLGNIVQTGHVAPGTNLTIKRNNLPTGTYIVSVYNNFNNPIRLKLVAQ